MNLLYILVLVVIANSVFQNSWDRVPTRDKFCVCKVYL